MSNEFYDPEQAAGMNHLIHLFGNHRAAPSSAVVTAERPRLPVASLQSHIAGADHAADDALPAGPMQMAVLLVDVQESRELTGFFQPVIGEQPVQSAGTALIACVRSSDTVIRCGDHEFSILINQVTCEEDVTRTAGRILECLTASRRINQCCLGFSTNIGIAIYPDHGTTADTLMSSARSALGVCISQWAKQLSLQRTFHSRQTTFAVLGLALRLPFE